MVEPVVEIKETPEEILQRINIKVRETVKSHSRLPPRSNKLDWNVTPKSPVVEESEEIDSTTFLHQINRSLEMPLYAAQKLIGKFRSNLRPR